MAIAGFIFSSIAALLTGKFVASYINGLFSTTGPYISVVIGIFCLFLAYLVGLGGPRNIGILLIILFGVPFFIAGIKEISNKLNS
jgi:hypothetical protein